MPAKIENRAFRHGVSPASYGALAAVNAIRGWRWTGHGECLTCRCARRPLRRHDDKTRIRKPGKLGLGEDGLDRIGHVLNREIAQAGLPGAVALIGREGRIGYFEAFGRRDPAKSEPMALDSIFRIYSMTKPIVSVAIMQLVEEGRISLLDPVAKFIPAFADMKVGVERDGALDLVPLARPISVQDLLRHTSGLTYDFVGASAVQKLYAEAGLARSDQTNADQVAALAKLPLLHQPGTSWDYSRSTDVLGRLIEIITGRTLGEELKRRIFEPLGMVDTGFAVPAKDHDRVAEPFAIDPDTKAPVKLLRIVDWVSFESGGGGLFSTAMDYARFCAMLAGGGALGKTRLLGRKTLAHDDIRSCRPEYCRSGRTCCRRATALALASRCGPCPA